MYKPIETIRKRSKLLRPQDNPHDYKTGLLTTNSLLLHQIVMGFFSAKTLN
jgi:hypothetical protein